MDTSVDFSIFALPGLALFAVFFAVLGIPLFAEAFGFAFDMALVLGLALALRLALAFGFDVALDLGLIAFAAGLSAAFAAVALDESAADAPARALTVFVSASFVFERTPALFLRALSFRACLDFVRDMTSKSLDFAGYSHINQEVVYVFLLHGH